MRLDDLRKETEMPTTRTRRKRGRADLDEHKLGMLLHGPDSGLLAGLGYVCPVTLNFYQNASQEAQKAILEAMRADWLLHRETVLAAAEGEPWAQREFGDAR